MASRHPCGFWPSDWSADAAAAASRDFAELQAGHGGLFWIEYDPAQARCTLWRWRAGAATCLTPPGFSLRSRVYEYGGGAFCLTGQGVAFVNEADQQVYLQDLAEDAYGTPLMLSARAECRYGDLQFDRRSHAILAVEEQGVEHRLVSLALADGARRIVAEGADFYASPALSPEGGRLAWIEWSRPAQPWTSTRLQCAERMADGQWGDGRCLAGADGEQSLQQPRFAADGRLYCLSDRHGGWQPWCEQQERLVPYPLAEERHGEGQGGFDCAPAPWQLGTISYLPLAAGGLLLTHMVDGFASLFEHAADGSERQLAGEYSRCRQLAMDDPYVFCIAGSPERTPAVLAIERASGDVRILAGGERPLPANQVSHPQPLRFATGEGETAHAFFYPPRNAGCRGRPGERPPLVVFAHGGPTSACYPVFDPRIQFWTQRGFAVVDVNYRGSSGFGRAYRQRLHEQWGVVDVEDVCQAARALAARGLIDPARVFVRGSSAGGFTALCALAASDLFRGGASLYGVSDPLALRRVTHKFEGDYLDWLIGDPQRVPQRFRERAPLHNADRIDAPVIFFQGGQDTVVPPEQTEAMVAALRRRGVAVEYRRYPQERHGFREARNQADALEREWRFYQRLL
ncbi:alpha/beta hydrolase family protein [Pseudomonas lopnurensis]|uniref:alpha/beta hydrolase family protein n=1 Tax=Pseudomonas lopnurensis TaxID=1477517 RepID=UPI00187A8DEB|nr:S9 family peptidase [Pseudomonas lopnurensis]MBE7377156.1 S9 family peptidase [Pseudomonas lopnurensis]